MTDEPNIARVSADRQEPARILTTYCIFCRTEIPEARQLRGSKTCSDNCKSEYRRLYFKDRHRRVCPVCGRRKRKNRV
jgi:hypothetical protein